ncbi:MAG: type II toxin-antitoxin system VapC family toxin [Gammaproteobacteria bacterium]|nr:type II toxin-antitoxin system VapC family toxin [Gammaproteobacteria bacterium]
MVVVPDASVILKWALPAQGEPDAARALALRDAISDERVRAVVPALWLYEVGNTIARRFPVHATGWLRALLKLGLAEAPITDAWLDRALSLTQRYPVTFYDAAYHATALMLRGVFVTPDRPYFDLAEKEGGVALLSEWRPPVRGAPKRRR